MTHYVRNQQMQQGDSITAATQNDDVKKVDLEPSAYEIEKQKSKEKQPRQQQR